ncbi:MAG TPA: BON domain-containing protein [Blastocatellia bacterium]|nr:BON domain-containing protein [Blastocatellia bacterium]
MRKSILAFIVITAISMALYGCATTSREGTGTGTASPAAKMSDSDLENSIKAKINSDEQLRAANLDVDANADRNEATLSGTVESEALRTRAVELAKSAHSGLIVTDKIDVKPRELSRSEYTDENAREERAKAKERGETIGSSLDDAWIHAKIVTKLIGNASTPERKINVDVNNNVVTLRGTVDTAEAKMEAERVAKETEGVKRVVNQLKVGAAASSTPAHK